MCWTDMGLMTLLFYQKSGTAQPWEKKKPPEGGLKKWNGQGDYLAGSSRIFMLRNHASS